MEKDRERIAIQDTISQSEQILSQIESQRTQEQIDEFNASVSALETLTSFFGLKGTIEILLEDFASDEEKEDLNKYFANLEYAQINLLNHENKPSDQAVFKWVEQTLKYAINILKKKQYQLENPDEPLIEEEREVSTEDQIQLIKEDLQKEPLEIELSEDTNEEQEEGKKESFVGKIFKGFFGKKETITDQKIQTADDYNDQKDEVENQQEKLITVEQANETQIENFNAMPENLRNTMKFMMQEVLKDVHNEEKVIISSIAAFIHHKHNLSEDDTKLYFNEGSDVDADFVGTEENISKVEENLNKLTNQELGNALVYKDEYGNMPGFNKSEIRGKFGKATRFHFYYKDSATGKMTDAEAFGSPEGNGLVQLKNIKQTITQVEGINITGERETKRTYLPVIGTELADCEIQKYVNAYKKDTDNIQIKEKIGARGKKLADMWGVSFVMGLINAWKQERNAYLESENQSPEMIKTIELIDKTMEILSKERNFFVNIYLKGIKEEDREKVSAEIENELENADISLEDLTILSEALKSTRKEMTKASVEISDASFEEIPKILNQVDEGISKFEKKLGVLSKNAGIMKMMLIGKLFTEFMQPMCKMAISNTKKHTKEMLNQQEGVLTAEQFATQKETFKTTAKLNRYLVQFLSYEVGNAKPIDNDDILLDKAA